MRLALLSGISLLSFFYPVGVFLAWLVGCALGLLMAGAYPRGLDPIYGLAFLGLGAVAGIATWRVWGDERLRGVSLMIAALLLGVGRALIINPTVTERDLAHYNADEGAPAVLVVGVVEDEPQRTDRSQRLRVRAEGIRLPGDGMPRDASGSLLAVVRRYPEYEAGARVALSGTLTAPPRLGTFDYLAYLARQGVRSYMYFPRANQVGSVDLGWNVTPVRARVSDAISRTIPEPHAALTIGVVTGNRASIPEKVQRAFNRSGTQHILAVSGQNIALLAGTFYLYFRWRNRRINVGAFLMLAALLGFYAFFTGLTPSVVRASVMAAIILLAPIRLRRPDPVAALLIAAFLMTLWDPDTLADGGFQLSFAAMLGILLVAPYPQKWLLRARVPLVLASPLAASLGAQLATLPLSIAFYELFSFAGIPATMLASLALLPLMVAGIGVGVLGAIPILGPLLGAVTWLPASWLLWWVEFWGEQPWAAAEITPVGLPWIAAYYATLGLGVWLLEWRRRENLYASGGS
jgi:competence protein ComEC